MAHFRCYALNERGQIVAAEDVEAPDDDAAIAAGWNFVRGGPATSDAKGLEVWTGVRRVFSGPDQEHTMPGQEAFAVPVGAEVIRNVTI